MKNIALVLLLAISVPAISQEKEGKNVAKVNVSAFAFKGFGVQYERQISKRFTIALGYSSIPKSTIAFKSLIEKQVDNPNVKIGDFKLGTSVFTPEVRYYVGKRGALHGFYVAPYARVSTYNIQGPVQFSTSISQRTAVFDGKINSFTGGLMLGSHFQLSKLFYLDWWILGGSVGSANGNLVAAIALTPTEQQSLKSELDDLDIPFTKIQSTVNSTGATVTTTGNIAGVRGLGLNLGIRF